MQNIKYEKSAEKNKSRVSQCASNDPLRQAGISRSPAVGPLTSVFELGSQAPMTYSLETKACRRVTMGSEDVVTSAKAHTTGLTVASAVAGVYATPEAPAKDVLDRLAVVSVV